MYFENDKNLDVIKNQYKGVETFGEMTEDKSLLEISKEENLEFSMSLKKSKKLQNELTGEEDRERGAVSLGVYKDVYSYTGGFCFYFFIALLSTAWICL